MKGYVVGNVKINVADIVVTTEKLIYKINNINILYTE